MEEKNMRELSMDELDKVSGGSGENPGDNTDACRFCGSNDIKPIFWWSNGMVEYQCNRCQRKWTVEK